MGQLLFWLRSAWALCAVVLCMEGVAAVGGARVAFAQEQNAAADGGANSDIITQMPQAAGSGDNSSSNIDTSSNSPSSSASVTVLQENAAAPATRASKPLRVQWRSLNSDKLQLHVVTQTQTQHNGYVGVSFGVGYSGWGPYGGWGPGWGGYWGTPMPYYSSYTSVSRNLTSLCEAPCSINFEPGAYQLAISTPQSGPVLVPSTVSLAGSSDPIELVGHYESRAQARLAGWIVLGVGIVAGTALMLASIDYNASYYEDEIRYPAMFGIGISTSLISLIAGGVLTSRNDRAWVDVVQAQPAQ